MMQWIIEGVPALNQIKLLWIRFSLNVKIEEHVSLEAILRTHAGTEWDIQQETKVLLKNKYRQFQEETTYLLKTCPMTQYEKSENRIIVVTYSKKRSMTRWMVPELTSSFSASSLPDLNRTAMNSTTWNKFDS